MLRSSAPPLDAGTLGFMESRFGRDFSQVRVHTGTQAADSARVVNAQAYTVGRDVVFGAGEYAPGTIAGRRLLAHELTHVVQQAGGGRRSSVQRSSIGSLPSIVLGPEDDALESEAHRAAETLDEEEDEVKVLERSVGPSLQRHPAFVGLDEAGPVADLTGKTEDQLFSCMKGAKADPEECVPRRSLAWDDFTGAPKGNFSAFTTAPVKDKPMDPQRAACLQRVLGKTTDQTRVFQAQLDSGKSWVRGEFKDPTNPSKTQCGKNIRNCESQFKKLKPNQTGTMTLSSNPNSKCGAAITPNPSVTATSKDECKTVLGAECTRVAQLESERLLRHEQGHFDISCVFARKANSALIAGGNFKDIKAAVEPLGSKKDKAFKKYDFDTDHGCIAAEQANWAGELANGLPKITIP
ncbi:MAG: DUF4157 domain-containing protein [Acidobacteriota bacterium]